MPTDRVRSSRGATVAAVLPALLFGLHAVAQASFVLIDDGTVLREIAGSPFHAHEAAGRLRPVYWLYNWALVRVLAAEPWAFALGNALVLSLAAYACFRLATRLSGAFAGVTAAWLFVCNLPFVENLYTYGKQEPLHVLFWLLLLGLLIRVADETKPSPGLTAASFVLAGACALSKETGVLAAVPAGVLLLAEAFDRRRAWKWPARVASVVVAVWVPTVGVAAAVVAMNRSAAAYSQRNLYVGGPLYQPTGWINWRGVARCDPALTVLLLVALIAALALCWTTRDRRRTRFLVIAAAFVALFGFFLVLPGLMTYYLFTPMALAAVLAGCAAGELWNAGRRHAAVLSAVGLVLYGLVTALLYARALVGWSGLYGRLEATVLAGGPGRVIFREPVGNELPLEATVLWRRSGVDIHVGVLGRDSEDVPPGVANVRERDLAAHDRIVERLGDAECNHRIPVRDFAFVLGPKAALANDTRDLHEVARHRAEFPCPVGLDGRPTFLEWRVYEVARAPRVAWRGLENGVWVTRPSTLWLRPEGAGELRMPVFVRDVDARQMRLLVCAGGRVLASCPARPGRFECHVPLRGLPLSDGWLELAVKAVRGSAPAADGEERLIHGRSFNLASARALGAEMLRD